MVTSKRKTPEYSLDAVHRLAHSEQVVFGAPKARRDSENLGYSLKDICECLENLTQQHYHESIYYDEDTWHDVYKRSWLAPVSKSHLLDELYIKFRLNRDCTCVFLSSFHL